MDIFGKQIASGLQEGGDVEFRSVREEYTEYKQIPTPSNPSSGSNKVYTKGDNNLYILDNLGNEVQFESSASGGSASTTSYDPSSSSLFSTNVQSAVDELDSKVLTHVNQGDIHFTEASIVHQNINGAGTNTHSQIDAHIGDLDKHRVINDSGVSTVGLWSSSKINTELNDLSQQLGDTTLQNVYDNSNDGINDVLILSDQPIKYQDTQPTLGRKILKVADSAGSTKLEINNNGEIPVLGTSSITDAQTDINSTATNFLGATVNLAPTNLTINPTNALNIQNDINLNINKIIGLANPSFNNDGANKKYVDDEVKVVDTALTNHTGDTTIHFTEASIDHANIQNVGTNSHSQIDTHIADLDKHRVINDGGSSATDLWSASKISNELSSVSLQQVYDQSANTLELDVDSNALSITKGTATSSQSAFEIGTGEFGSFTRNLSINGDGEITSIYGSNDKITNAETLISSTTTNLRGDVVDVRPTSSIDLVAPTINQSGTTNTMTFDNLNLQGTNVNITSGTLNINTTNPIQVQDEVKMNNNIISGLPLPTANDNVANKQYVDDSVANSATATNLQNVYEGSGSPAITTNGTDGPFALRDGIGVGTDVLRILDNPGTGVVFNVKENGYVETIGLDITPTVCSFTKNAIPSTTDVLDLGTAVNKWKDLWVSGSLYQGSNSIGTTTTSINSNNMSLTGVTCNQVFTDLTLQGVNVNITPSTLNINTGNPVLIIDDVNVTGGITTTQDINVGLNFKPSISTTSDIGSDTLRFKDLHLSNNALIYNQGGSSKTTLKYTAGTGFNQELDLAFLESLPSTVENQDNPPTMSSPTLVDIYGNWTASASTELTDEFAWEAFDGNTATNWCCSNVDTYNITSGEYTGANATQTTVHTTGTYSGEYITMESPITLEISRYDITKRLVAGIAQRTAPRDFALFYKVNVGDTWIQANTQVGEVWNDDPALDIQRQYTVSPPVTGKFFRLAINKIGDPNGAGNKTAVCISDLNFFGNIIGSAALNLKTNTDITGDLAVSGEVRYPLPVANMIMTGNTIPTDLGDGIDEVGKVAGATTMNYSSTDFTQTDNRLTYVGTATRAFVMSCNFSFSTATNNTIRWVITVRKNGTIILPGGSVQRGTTDNNLSGSASCQCITEMNQNDYLELWVQRLGGNNSDPIFQEMSMILTALPN